jgi:hypothetical protein
MVGGHMTALIDLDTQPLMTDGIAVTVCHIGKIISALFFAVVGINCLVGGLIDNIITDNSHFLILQFLYGGGLYQPTQLLTQ